MSFNINSTNIAPIAYGSVSSTGVLTNSYNCSSSASANVYTITITSPPSNGLYVPIATVYNFGGGGGNTFFISAQPGGTSNTVKFFTFINNNTSLNNSSLAFNFVIFGN